MACPSEAPPTQKRAARMKLRSKRRLLAYPGGRVTIGWRAALPEPKRRSEGGAAARLGRQSRKYQALAETRAEREWSGRSQPLGRAGQCAGLPPPSAEARGTVQKQRAGPSWQSMGRARGIPRRGIQPAARAERAQTQ